MLDSNALCICIIDSSKSNLQVEGGPRTDFNATISLGTENQCLVFLWLCCIQKTIPLPSPTPLKPEKTNDGLSY